jgi:hypothetical protein
MGWCSATEIFDGVIKEIIGKVDDETLNRIALRLGMELQNHDWDCECDSDYFDDPRLRKTWKELLGEYYEDNWEKK